MKILLFAVLPFLLAVPDVLINWQDEANDTVSLVVRGKDEQLRTCLDAGLELRYFFELQLCKRRPFWLDTCQDSKELVKRVHFDPISRNYEIEENWSHAVAQKQEERFSKASDMLHSLRNIEVVSLRELAGESDEFVNSQRSYFSVRLHSECSGEDEGAVADLSQFFSFGLVQLNGFDTGWIDFRLRS